MKWRTRTAPFCRAASRYGILASLSSALLIASGVSRADTLTTAGGEVVHGTELRLSAGKVSIRSDALGTVDVAMEKIASVATSEAVDVHFTNEARLRGRVVIVGKGLMALEFSPGSRSIPFALASVRSISAPSPTVAPEQWTSTGNVNAGLTSSAGSSDAQLLHVDGQLTLRRGGTRYNARGEANFRRENDQELANDARFKLQHDYFFRERWFFYTGAGVEHDTARDLRLRTDLGTGTGYQFIDTVRTSVSAEGGPSYVIEDYGGSGDASYGAIRWAMDLRYDPILMRLSLFHHHEVLAAITARGGTVVRSRTGARYNLGRGLTATGQAKIDWDSDPSPGEGETDIVYLFSLGYAW